MNEDSSWGTVLPSRHQPPIPIDRAIREESPDTHACGETHGWVPLHRPRGESLPGASDPAT